MVYGGFQIHPATYTDIILFIRRGELLVGHLQEVSGREFSWLILDEGSFRAYAKGDRPSPEVGAVDVRASEVRWRVPGGGRWYLVLEAYGKPSGREVLVDLRRGDDLVEDRMLSLK